MSISEKIKAINHKTEESKAEYNLDGQTAKVSASSSVNVSNCEILTGKDVLFENDFLKKNSSNQKIWIFSVSQGLEKKNEENKTKNKKRCTSWNLVYNKHKVTKLMSLLNVL